MAKKRKAKSRKHGDGLLPEHEYNLRSAKLRNWLAGIRAAAWLTGVWLFFSGVEKIANTNTYVGIDIPFLDAIDATRALLFALLICVVLVVVTILGVGYGLRYKKLYEQFIAERAPYIETLESEIDPARSSSRLTKKGHTRPEDL